MFRCVAVMLLAVAWSSVAPAQIYEWRDADGSRHFTTDVEDLPTGQRENPRVIVRQSVRRADAASEAVRDPVESRREAQIVYDHSLSRRRESDVAQVAGGSVYIQGPLAVANVDWVPPPAAGYGQPVAAIPLAFPLVNTSFDRGRSRHLTLRMLLQDQFQLDRDGPYVYERLGGLGPQFRAFLPRGLPRHYPRGGVVVTR